MKIEYRKGDLFQTDVKTIVHGCNAQGVMGSGVAKIVREQFPKAYERYVKEYKLHNHLNLGSIMAVPCNNKIIVNAITQEWFGSDGQRYVSYDAVDDAMQKINNMYEVYGYDEVAMPQIGAGLGGGSWEVIEQIIEHRLDKVTPIVYIL